MCHLLDLLVSFASFFNTSFNCLFCSGEPPLTFNWTYNGRQIDSRQESSTGIRVESNVDYSILSIKSVEVSHAGNYSCHVSNQTVQVTHSSVLRVNGKCLSCCSCCRETCFFTFHVSQTDVLNKEVRDRKWNRFQFFFYLSLSLSLSLSERAERQAEDFPERKVAWTIKRENGCRFQYRNRQNRETATKSKA